MSDPEGQLRVSKTAAADENLFVAIRLLFEPRCSVVSVYTLAHASAMVFRDLLLASGSGSMIRDLMIKEEHRKCVNRKLNEIPNYLKHADRKEDPAELAVSVDQAECVIFDTVEMRLRLVGEHSIETAVFLAYFCAKHPEILLPSELKNAIDSAISSGGHLDKSLYNGILSALPRGLPAKNIRPRTN